MKKTLIVYHSRSGHTRRVAQALARRLSALGRPECSAFERKREESPISADLDEIRIVQPMEGWLGYLMCAVESLAALPPALRPGRHRSSEYELVLIGTPVWFWNVSSPVRSWLQAHALKHRVAFFCTMGGSGSRRAFATMAELAGKEPVATLALTEREVASGEFEPRLDAFVRQLAAGAPRPRHMPARHGLPAAA
jgi:menaquinone-dependent protoporphyrinogen IX oxidase